MQIGFIPRALAAVGLHGLAQRALLSQVGYESARATLAAAQKDRTNSDWPEMKMSPMDVWSTDAAIIRQRANHMAQSDVYGVRVAEALVSGMIGDGIRTQVQVDWMPHKPESKLKTKRNTAINNQIERLKSRWMKNADAETIGASKKAKKHWFDIQRLAFRRVVVDGECIMVRQYTQDKRGKLELRWKMISASRLSTNGAQTAPGNVVIEGIELTPDGQVAAYHIAPQVTASYISAGVFPVRVPADDVIHTFRHDFPEQYRGFSWYTPIIPDLNHLSSIKTYSLIARRVQASIALVVSRPAQSSGTGSLSLGGAIPGAGQGAQPKAAEIAKPRKIEPGLIHDVGEGTVHSHNPSPSGDLDPLTKLLLRGIGVAMGLSYEIIASDYQGTSFAGGRLGKLETDANRRIVNGWFSRTFEHETHVHLMDWLLASGQLIDILIQYGITDIHPDVDLYDARFSRPRTEWGVNPLQEVQAAALAIKNGLGTLRDDVESRGRDLDDHLEQIARESGILQSIIEGYAEADNPSSQQGQQTPAEPANPEDPAKE